MPFLTITRGLPGAGKTTYARRLQGTDPTTVRVNRDDLRRMMWVRPDYSAAQEAAVTVAQETAVRRLLGAGWSVIADDTNVRPEHVDQWCRIAEECGATFVIKDLSDVGAEECIRRQPERPEGDRVPEHVIRRMAKHLTVTTS